MTISCITYNHAPFIEKCLEGFIAQRTHFSFEVVIHDDASTDGTAEIVLEYCERFPVLFRPILQKENQYRLGKKPTWDFNAPRWRGKYVALCEGDDYWIDPLKLQKQVDAMEADSGAVGCFTDAWNEKDGERTSYMDGIYANKPDGTIMEQREMLRSNIPTCTFLFRREHLFPLPEILVRAPVGDAVLYIHLTRVGHLLYLPGHTAVRVMHAGGAHALSGRLHRINVKERLWPLLDEMTMGRHREEFKRMFTAMYRSEWGMAVRAGDRQVLKHVWPRMAERRHEVGWRTTTVVRNWIKAWLPALDRMVALMRG